MQNRGNRDGPLRVWAQVCVVGSLLAPPALSANGVDWRCRDDAGSGWHCDGPAPEVLLAAAPPAADDEPLPPTSDVEPLEPVPDAGETEPRNAASTAAPAAAAPAAPLTAADRFEITDDLAASLWVPRAELAPQRAARMPGYCRGAYRIFSYPHPVDSDPDRFPIHADGARARYQLDGDVDLEGDVRLEQGNRTVAASRAYIDQTSREGRVSGGVRLHEPGLVMQGEEARVNLDTKAAVVREVDFVLLDSALRGDARVLAQDGEGNMTMTGGSFTRCEPGNENWRLSASSVVVEEDDVFGTARDAVLRVRGVPVFYTPYIRFPVTDDRQSGWLFPNLAYSDEDGTDVSLPYYLNLAPNYDATLIPRYVSKRGAGLEGEFRHLSGWQETVLSGAYLHDDDLYDGVLSRKDFDELAAAGEVSGEFEPEERWLYAMEHSGAFGNFTTRVDYTAVSDRDYFRDLGSDLSVSSEIELERRGEIQYAQGGLLVRLWGQRFQRLDESRVDPYQRLPELDISYVGDLPGPFEWSVMTSAVTFDRNNDDLTGRAAVVGDRIHVEPRLRMPLTAPWGFLTLTGGYRHTRYDLRDVAANADTRPERSIGLGSAHAGLFFERELGWFGHSLVQTLEPQVFYLYQEYEPQQDLPSFDASRLTFGFSQLFRDNRFSGLDRISDANQASYGLTTRFLDAGNGTEYFRASAGVIQYFEDRRVTLSGQPGEDEEQSTSAIAGELAARLRGGWSASGTTVWDPHDSRWEELGAALQYRGDSRHIVNLGYRKRLENDIDQTDVSLYWPVSRHFAVMGRWNYDLVSGRTIEGFGGIEYNDCCWQIRLMARRFLDSPSGRQLATAEADEGVFVQIVFKGLAGFGDKVESVLSRGIRGYRTEMMDEYQAGF